MNTILPQTIDKGLYKISDLDSNFDRIAIKLGIISICSVALSCYTSPTSSFVPQEDDTKHPIFCVGQMPKNLPSGRLLVTFKATE